jgi:toxin ParE1/3/4
VKLRYTKRALADLDRILSYIAQRSPQGANSVARQVDETVRRVKDFPRSGRTTNRPNIRLCVVEGYPYLIFYRITRRSEISVVHIRHAARKSFAR